MQPVTTTKWPDMTDTQSAPRKTFKTVALRLAAVVVALGLTGALWITLAPVSFWSFLTPDYTGQTLSVSQAHQQAQSGDITLIDIRRPDEWKRSGVGVGANPLDMRRKDFIEQLDLIVAGDRSRPVALMCARGVRSAKMSKKLTAAGFTQIIDVPEGMLGSRAGPGWLKSKLPTLEYQGASK